VWICSSDCILLNCVAETVNSRLVTSDHTVISNDIISIIVRIYFEYRYPNDVNKQRHFEFF
jgi:hypothetical protein